ncbi:putative polysaccharide biosynthesis protein [Clostridium rectalis]|uniref:putative polysaccharide biosynthesis protein n=1 Tax=Clostridium rectalis TaxID=2040295 RepID=UPI000F644D3E|nr:polysaccharide biosynthesis protein [Clostridium rectalis]
MKEQSTTKGFAILSAAGMIVKVLSLLYIPFLQHIITQEGYGIYGAANSVYVFIYVLTNSGIPIAISKLVSELTAVKNYKDAIRSFKMARFILLILGIVMSLFMIIFARPLSSAIKFKQSYLAILALAPAILFTSIASAYRGYFQGWGNMAPTAISQVIEQVINTIFTLAFAALLMRYGMEAGCAGGTIGTSLGAFFSASYLIFFYEKNKRIRVPKGYGEVSTKRYTSKQILKKIIDYGLPITICVGMTYAGNLIDVGNTKARLIVGGIAENEANILYGQLLKYQQLINVPIAIITSLATAILPAISSAVAINDRKQIKNKVRYAFRLCFLIAIPSAFGLAILSDPVYSLLKFGDGAYLMSTGAIVLVLMSVMQIQTAILQSIGRLYTATVYSIIGIVFKILVNYFLISVPEINIMGAIYGTIIGYTIPIILNHRTLRRTLGVKFKFLASSIKPILASVTMNITVFIAYGILNSLLRIVSGNYLSNLVACIVSIIIGMYTYLLSLVVLGGITRDDFNVIPSKIIRFIPKFIVNKLK